MMYYTYVLRTKNTKRYYTGYTDDLRKRLKEHTKGLSTYTKSRGPYDLVYYEACTDAGDAQARELYLKTGKGKRYIKTRLRRFLFRTG